MVMSGAARGSLFPAQNGISLPRVTGSVAADSCFFLESQVAAPGAMNKTSFNTSFCTWVGAPETAGLQPPPTASSLNSKATPYTRHAVAVQPPRFKVHKLALLRTAQSNPQSARGLAAGRCGV
jgi:hypothetical protein